MRILLDGPVKPDLSLLMASQVIKNLGFVLGFAICVIVYLGHVWSLYLLFVLPSSYSILFPYCLPLFFFASYHFCFILLNSLLIC